MHIKSIIHRLGVPTLQAGIIVYIRYPGLTTRADMLRPFRACRAALTLSLLDERGGELYKKAYEAAHIS